MTISLNNSEFKADIANTDTSMAVENNCESLAAICLIFVFSSSQLLHHETHVSAAKPQSVPVRLIRRMEQPQT
jgi:hypothetical protein